MIDLQDEAYVSLAVDVMRAQNPRAIVALKNFLTVLPNPTAIEITLERAVYQLADIDRSAYCWMLQQSDLLMPELDLEDVVRQWIRSTLTREGYDERDFDCDRDGCFHFSDAAKTRLWQVASDCDRLLLEEILHISEDIDREQGILQESGDKAADW